MERSRWISKLGLFVLLLISGLLILLRLVGDDMGSIYLQKGNLAWALTLGLLSAPCAG